MKKSSKPGKENISLERIDLTDDLKEMRRIAQLYVLEKSPDVLPIPKGTTEASVVYGRLVFQAAQIAGKHIRTFKSFKQTAMLLRETAGMQKVKDWLNRPNNRSIFQANTETFEFKSLWYFNEQAIASVVGHEDLQKHVEHHFVWFKIVDLILSRGSKLDQQILLRGEKWYKHSIIINLVIAATLRQPFKRLTRDEFSDFIKKVADYDVWLSGFRAEIDDFFQDTVLCEMFIQHPDVRKFITDLAKESYRTIFTLGRMISWERSDAVGIDKARTLVHQAFRYAYSNKKREIKKMYGGQIDELNGRLLRIRPAKLMRLIVQYPIFFYWLNDDVAGKIVRYLPMKDPLRKKLSITGFPAWMEVEKVRPVRVIDVSEMESISEADIVSYAQKLLKETILKDTIDHLREWIRLLDRTHAVEIPIELFPETVLVALYLFDATHALPTYIVDTVQHNEFARWFDNEDVKIGFRNRFVHLAPPDMIHFKENEKGIVERTSYLHL